MQTNEIKEMIEAGLPGCEARVTGDGTHFEATVIGEVFRDKSLIEKHRMVYGTLGDNVEGGAIHALSIRAYTPEEWERQNELKIT